MRLATRSGFAFGLVFAGLLAGGAAPLPIEGVWRAGSGGGRIELHMCDDALCGRVVASDDLRADPDLRDVNNKKPEMRDRLMRGLDIFHGFHGGPDVWTNGRIYNPNDGRTYHGTLRLLPDDRVKVTGCLIGPLCGSQVWVRAR